MQKTKPGPLVYIQACMELVGPRAKRDVKVIIMPNGDGVFASRITGVEHSLGGQSGGPHPIVWPSRVKVGGVMEFDVCDDETAVAERNRILAEWRAWIEMAASACAIHGRYSRELDDECHD